MAIQQSIRNRGFRKWYERQLLVGHSHLLLLLLCTLALLGVGITGGFQVGYATLVDLETGQVLWFNQVISGMGDLRDEKSAAASVDSLLAGFPGSAATRQ